MFELIKAADCMTLKLNGEMTIQTAAELKAILMQTIYQTGRLTLDFSKITKADISFFQLVCAVNKSAQKQGVKLAVTGTDSPELNKWFELSGFAHYISSIPKA